MGEKHKLYSIVQSSGNNRSGEVMASIFSFISSSGQDAIRFAHNSTAESVSSSLGFGGSPTFTNFVSGSFIVVEPTVAMPSGYRWQSKIEIGPGTVLSSTLSTVGGWDAATKIFKSASTLNPPNITPPVTNAIPWMTAQPTQGDQIMISSCDLDTYTSGSSTVKAPYFRLIVKQGYSAAFSPYSFYVGSYIPLEIQNTNPVCFLARIPYISYNNAAYWGSSAVNTSNLTRVAPDYTFATTDLSASYAGLSSVTFIGNLTNPGNSPFARDLDGGWVNFPIYVLNLGASVTLGYFGKYNMLCGYINRGYLFSDPAQEYAMVYDSLMRWKPSA